MTRPTSGDIVAGISVALLALPQGLAYAELAGLPAEYGPVSYTHLTLPTICSV